MLRKEMNVSINTQNKNLNTLLQELGSYQIVLPEFQRDYQWSQKDICLLVNSLYQGIPVPPIYLYKEDINHRQWKILDGQQRMFGLFLYYNDLFFSNEYKLNNNDVCYTLKNIPKLDNENYIANMQELLKKYEIDSIYDILYKEITENIKYREDFKKVTYNLDKEDMTYSKLSFENKISFGGFSLTVVEIIAKQEFALKIFNTINSTAKKLHSQQIRDAENWDLFKVFYNAIDELSFINSTKQKYLLIEDIFEIIIKALYFNDNSYFKTINSKDSLYLILDKAHKIIQGDKLKQEDVLKKIDELKKMKNLEIYIDQNPKVNKKLLLILALNFGEDKAVKFYLISEGGKLESEIKKLEKYYTREEAIFRLLKIK